MTEKADFTLLDKIKGRSITLDFKYKHIPQFFTGFGTLD